jgi:hypothetical protein
MKGKGNLSPDKWVELASIMGENFPGLPEKPSRLPNDYDPTRFVRDEMSFERSNGARIMLPTLRFEASKLKQVAAMLLAGYLPSPDTELYLAQASIFEAQYEFEGSVGPQQILFRSDSHARAVSSFARYWLRQRHLKSGARGALVKCQIIERDIGFISETGSNLSQQRLIFSWDRTVDPSFFVYAMRDVGEKLALERERTGDGMAVA